MTRFQGFNGSAFLDAHFEIIESALTDALSYLTYHDTESNTMLNFDLILPYSNAEEIKPKKWIANNHM